MVFDGRVDNRAELKDALTSAGMPPRDDTDAELVLRAYECWGEESPARILGDFAYVIWDGARKRLFCARDPLGVKPLYYHLDAKRFVCASELQALLLEPEFPVEPNEGMAAEIMCGRVLDPEETLFRDIVQVVPGNYLTIEPGKVRKRRYWSLNSIARHPLFRRRAVRVAFFRSVQEAVRCRMRHPGTGVAAQLSGGLDSSSVVSMAAYLKRRGRRRCRSLRDLLADLARTQRQRAQLYRRSCPQMAAPRHAARAETVSVSPTASSRSVGSMICRTSRTTPL